MRNDLLKRLCLTAVVVCVSTVRCGESETIALPPLVPFDGGSTTATDGEIDANLPPVSCQTDSDCDDGVMCNHDTCGWQGTCIHIPDPSFCDDGVFCNGEEICHQVEGCSSGIPVNCEDHNVCTVDRCDEETRRCVHEPRDFDHDGEVDWHCAGGTDCDDFDPARSSRVPEICDDSVDNDCDGETDESECGRPDHDLCEGALEVTGSGSYLVDIRGAAPDYEMSCEESEDRDVVVALLLSETRDVTIRAAGLRTNGGTESAAVAIRTDCDDISSERDCNRGSPGQIRMRALPADRYFIFVSNQTAPEVSLEIDLDEPTDPPSNPTCESPIDATEGGRFAVSFTDVSDDYDIACGSEGSGDLVYEFTLEHERDLVISAGNDNENRMSFAVRTDCEDPETTIQCVTGEPATTRLYNLASGTYYIVVEGPSYKEIDSEIELAFTDPTEAPVGNGCDNPATLNMSTAANATLEGRTDEVPTSCGFFYPDMIYRLEIEQPIDVGIRVEGGNAPMTIALETECGAQESELLCVSNTPAVKRFRNLQPDTYYLVVESIDRTNFVAIAESLPLTVPTEVSGNDNCATAFSIPSEGGLFRGDTSDMAPDYVATRCGGNSRSNDAVFKLTLSESKRVLVELEALFDSVFDTVLYRFSYTVDGADACDSDQESSCDDDSGPGNNSELDEVLPPGDHYYVIDGFGLESAGEYVLNVEVSDP